MGHRRVGGALRDRDVLRALRLCKITRLIEAQIDIAFFIAALEFPGLHPGADHRDLVARLVDVIAAGLQRLLPHPDTADGHEDRSQDALVLLLLIGGDGLAARIRGHPLLLTGAGSRLLRDHVAEIYRRDNVGLDDADRTLGYVNRILDVDVP